MHYEKGIKDRECRNKNPLKIKCKGPENNGFIIQLIILHQAQGLATVGKAPIDFLWLTSIVI